MTLPIADCRLPIGKLPARCGFARRSHDGGEVIGFLQQCRQFGRGKNSRLAQQFEPEGRFISFLFDGANLGNEFRFASGAASCPVIRGHRSAAANDLLRNDSSSVIAFWHRTRKFDNPKSESFRALFEFGGVHGAKLQNQLAIANRQSKIP